MSTQNEQHPIWSQAWKLFQADKIADAIPQLEKLIRDEPTHVDALFTLGVCRFRSKDLGESERLFWKVISLDAESHLSYYYLGLIRERQGKDSDAVSQYRRALEVRPGFPEAIEKLQLLGQNVQPAQAPAASSSTQAENFEAQAGELIAAGHPRISSYSGLFILSIVLTPIFGIGLVMLLGLLVSSQATTFRVHQRRIDMSRGVFSRILLSIWLFEVTEVTLQQSLLDRVTNNARMLLHCEGGATQEIRGLGDAAAMNELWQKTRDSALNERVERKHFLV